MHVTTWKPLVCLRSAGVVQDSFLLYYASYNLKTLGLYQIRGWCQGKDSSVSLCYEMLHHQNPSSVHIRSEDGLDDRVYAMNVITSTPFICPHQIRGWSWWQGACHECYNINTLHLPASDQRVVLMTGCMPWMLQHQNTSSGASDQMVVLIKVFTVPSILRHKNTSESSLDNTGPSMLRYENQLSALDQTALMKPFHCAQHVTTWTHSCLLQIRG